MPACPLAIQQALDLIFNQGVLPLEHSHTRQRALVQPSSKGLSAEGTTLDELLGLPVFANAPLHPAHVTALAEKVRKGRRCVCGCLRWRAVPGRMVEQRQ
jgi:hypothetical protein